MKYIVITSNERNVKIPDGLSAQFKTKGNLIRWMFSSAEDAYKYAKKFKEAGFRYVHNESSRCIGYDNRMIVFEGNPIGTLYPEPLERYTR